MDGPISARYFWDAETMTEGLAAHHRHGAGSSSRPFRILILLFVAALSVGIPTWLILDSRTKSLTDIRRNAAIALVVAIGVWLFYLDAIHSKRWLRRNARRALSMGVGPHPVEWSIGPEGLENRTPVSSSIFLWSLIIETVEVEEGFLLYQGRQLFYWLPGHAFSSDPEVRRFAGLARAKVANYVVRGECRFPAKPEPIGLDEL